MIDGATGWRHAQSTPQTMMREFAEFIYLVERTYFYEKR